MANTAVYGFFFGPADITQAGGLSSYGTMGQGGNAFEWEETDFDLTNGPAPGSFDRGLRGGIWVADSSFLLSSFRVPNDPAIEDQVVGFRVASIPEPSSLLLGAMASMGLLMRRRR